MDLVEAVGPRRPRGPVGPRGPVEPVGKFVQIFFGRIEGRIGPKNWSKKLVQGPKNWSKVQKTGPKNWSKKLVQKIHTIIKPK